MKRKFVWFLLSCLMVTALVLSSCAEAVTEEEEEVAPPAEEEEVAPPVEEEEVAEERADMVKWTGTKADGTVVEKWVEKPRYGGTFRRCQPVAVLGFDDASTFPSSTNTLFVTNEDLLEGNWAKGPAGTGEATWYYNTFLLPLQAMNLAESWEMPDDDTFIFHIRKGVHFHDKPPTNGREMTAEDVVFSQQRIYESPSSYLHNSYPDTIQSITAPDKWTVVMKCTPGWAG